MNAHNIIDIGARKSNDEALQVLDDWLAKLSPDDIQPSFCEWCAEVGLTFDRANCVFSSS